MSIKELINQSEKIISGRMRLDWFSRFYGVPVYKQYRDKISEEEVRLIQDELLNDGIFSEAEMSAQKYYLRLLQGRRIERKNKYFLHIFLFLLTIITTSMTGALLRGKDPFASWENFSYGFAYSFALLAILFAHEMGHYLYSRYYKVDVTLPYFIPFFIPGFHPGTLGAFIKMRSPIPDKKALFDIGIAGPLAGFVLSVIFLIAGFSMLPDEAGIYNYIAQIHPLDSPDGIALTLGNTLLYDFIASFFGGQRLPMSEMYHFPFIFAGWFGLLVTAINLMPIGQLDGGHITFSMFGHRARFVAMGAFVLLILLNVYLISNYNSYIWVLWSVLILVFVRFKHPPTLNDRAGLGTARIVLGWISYVIFIVCFSPMPIYLS